MLKDACGLALYGWPDPVSGVQAIALLERIATHFESPPADLGYLKSKGDWKSLRYSTFKKGLKPNLTDDLVGASLSIPSDPSDRGFMMAFRAYMRCNKRPIVQLTISEHRVSSYPEPLLEACRLFLEAVTPRYGYVYRMPFAKGAELFPTGISYSYGNRKGEDRDLDQRNMDFRTSFMFTNAHLEGKLRDVFDVNILSRLHLDGMIQGRTLEAWIAYGGRGSLEVLKPGVWAWSVPPEVLASVRKDLLVGGLLVVTV